MKRRSIVVLAALVSTLTFGQIAYADDPNGGPQVAKSPYDSYIVIMKADPLAATNGDNLNTASARLRGNALEASHDATLKSAGVNQTRKLNDYTVTLNGFSANVTHQQAVKLAGNDKVLMVLPDVLRQPMTDASPRFLGLDQGGGAWKSGLTGKGVVVGVIDTGIWPEHPSFADKGLPAPPTGPIPCEFGNTAHNPADAPFTCNHKLIGARQMLNSYRFFIGAEPDEFDSARDDAGHGTHTASTAAGDSNVQAFIGGRKVGSGKISGMAPDAHIIAYKGLGELGGFTSDLAEAIDQAVADGVNVINYSIGGGGGTITADTISFLFAADAGVYVAVSAGNSGPNPGTIGGPSDVPWVTSVGASTQERFISGEVKLGNFRTFEGASITKTLGQRPLVDAAAVGNELCDSTVPFSASVAGKIVLCKRGGNGRIDKGLAVYNAGGAGMILYNFTNDDNLFTDTHWVPSVHVNFSDGSAIKSYIAAAGSHARAEIRKTNELDRFRPAPSTTYFSSRGPNNWPDVIKPDVTAPGLQVLAGYSPYPDAGEVPGDLFAAIAGTSMSSPHVAGLFALLKQAHPTWSAAEAKSALMTTAYQDVRDSNVSKRADPFDMGSGHVNLGRPGSKGSAFQPGLAYDAGFNDYLGWLCYADPSVFSNPAATCAFLEANGFSTDPSNLNYPSIAVAALPGTQTVTRTVTSVASSTVTYKAKVDKPSGFDVTVTPSQITLAPGATATFEVTISNASAPLGEWRFGSLTWVSTKHDHDHHGFKPSWWWWGGGNPDYEVRSPIAVNASQIGFPSSVSGSGVTGSTSVPVRFGYTGAYNATAQGLTAALVTNDTVNQDPNQTFSPSDVGAGSARAYTFNLSGAGVFRIALPPDSVANPNTIDLDVYVYDPTNTQVASSTSSGTDELVNLEDPANGTWTVYVHGWQTAGPSAAFTLYSWVVPANDDPGGSLQIGSAPPSAVKNTSGNVVLNWTGATAGQWFFGALGHFGPSASFLGRTLVEVDNR